MRKEAKWWRMRMSALVKSALKSRKFIVFTHQPCCRSVNTFWQSLNVYFASIIFDETKRTLFRIQVATHCMLLLWLLLLLVCVVSYFCCFLFSIRVVYTCDFQLALFTLINFLFVHTYHETFTNINNNNSTYELICVLSRLRFRFVSFFSQQLVWNCEINLSFIFINICTWL